MAYLRMRITIEALENNRKILWKKQEKASENLTGKAKNFTIRSNNHNKYKMDWIITKNQEGQEQPQINDIWYWNLTRYGETEWTDVYIWTKVKIIWIDPNHTFTYAWDTTRFTLVEYEFLPPQSWKSSSHINVFLREFTKKERTYVPMPMTAKLANSILWENKKEKIVTNYLINEICYTS